MEGIRIDEDQEIALCLPRARVAGGRDLSVLHRYDPCAMRRGERGLTTTQRAQALRQVVQRHRQVRLETRGIGRRQATKDLNRSLHRIERPLIIPRRHVASWFDATREEQLAILDLADQVKADLDAHGIPRFEPGTQNTAPGTGLRPDGYNLGLNIGAAAGQTIVHLHLHVIPRFEGDSPDPRGGVRWIFPDKARYWDE